MVRIKRTMNKELKKLRSSIPNYTELAELNGGWVTAEINITEEGNLFVDNVRAVGEEKDDAR